MTQANIQSTICSDGYTRTVRPSESITEPEKEASLAAYGDSGPLHEFEYDHLVPLELDGAPRSAESLARARPQNLWPEPGRTPNPKDQLERRLREMVCSGELGLGAAPREIATERAATYRRLLG